MGVAAHEKRKAFTILLAVHLSCHKHICVCVFCVCVCVCVCVYDPHGEGSGEGAYVSMKFQNFFATEWMQHAANKASDSTPSAA